MIRRPLVAMRFKIVATQPTWEATPMWVLHFFLVSDPELGISSINRAWSWSGIQELKMRLEVCRCHDCQFSLLGTLDQMLPPSRHTQKQIELAPCTSSLRAILEDNCKSTGDGKRLFNELSYRPMRRKCKHILISILSQLGNTNEFFLASSPAYFRRKYHLDKARTSCV